MGRMWKDVYKSAVDARRGKNGTEWWRVNQWLCDTLKAEPHPKPGWRNWQTQRTQNPPTLAVMGVRPPLPAP